MSSSTLARDIEGTVFRDGTATLLARVVDRDGLPLTPGATSTVRYTINELAADGTETPVVGHDDVALTPSACLGATLTRDILWNVDDLGYNFRHEIDISANGAFSVAGKTYRVEYRIQPVAGQKIIVRFKLRAV